MAQTITEGLFPSVAGLFSPVGTEQTQRLQAAGQPVDPLQAVSGSMGFLGERMQQGIGSAFGQMPQQDRKRQVFQQLVQQLSQQGVDISTADGMVQLAQKLSSLPGFEGEALNLRQKAAQMAQQQRATGLEESKTLSEIARNKAQEEKALQPTQIQPRAIVTTDLGDRVRIFDPNTGKTTYEKKGLTPKQQEGDAPLKVGYDKQGRYTNQYGEVFSAPELKDRRKEVQQVEKVLQTMKEVSGKDVAQAGGLLNYTEGWFGLKPAVGALFDSDTYQAQLKIRASTLKELLANLPPGVASDKDVELARSSQPDFRSPASVADWFERASRGLNRALQDYEDRYGIKSKYSNMKMPDWRSEKESSQLSDDDLVNKYK